MWVTSDIHHYLRGWTFVTFPELALKEKFNFHAHNDKISAMVLIEDINIYVTCSLDGMIKFWDERSFGQMKEFELPSDGMVAPTVTVFGKKVKKARSILGMIHSQVHSNSIVMWGFSSSIHIYNPYFSITNPYQSSYKGHAGIIKDCQFLVSSSCCVSIDNKKCLRIWNVKSLDTA